MFGFFKRKADTPSISAAVACAKKGDHEGALRIVEALIRQSPEVAMSHRFKGETLFALEKYDDAIFSFERAEALSGPGIEDVFFWRALAHANAGRATQAIEILQGYAESTNADPAMAQKCGAAIRAIQQQLQ